MPKARGHATLPNPLMADETRHKACYRNQPMLQYVLNAWFSSSKANKVQKDKPESVVFRLHGGHVPLQGVLLHADLGQPVGGLVRLQLHLLDLARELHDRDLLRIEVAVGRDVGAGRVLLPFLALVLFLILWRCVERGRRWRRLRLLLLCLPLLVALGLLFLGLLLQKMGAN